MNHRRAAVILGILTFAFLLRVLGQAIVAVREVSWLPPMREWYSGLMPYPLLLPTQLAILAVQVKISRDIGKGSGFFARRRPTAGRGLRGFSYVYFAGMVLRYVLTMSYHPERRWTSGTIPIIFHCVLAAYLFVLGTFHTSRTATPHEEKFS